MRFSALVVATLLTCPMANAADTTAAPAPSPQEVRAEAVDRAIIAISRTQVSADRQKAVTLSIPLSPTEAEGFWPLYREYHGETDKLTDRYYDLIINYAKAYPNVSDDQAKKMLDEYNSIDSDRLALRKKYGKKFLKVIPAVKVARYLQIEHRLDVLEALDNSSQIPLIK